MIKLKDLLTVDALSDARFDTLEVGGITADSRTVCALWRPRWLRARPP